MIWAFFFSACYAHDWGEREGRLKNVGSSEYYCYRDSGDEIIETLVAPGSECLGDAIGDPYMVFKVPNRTIFECDVEACWALRVRDGAIFWAARAKNGWDKYGWMSFQHFLNIMGNKSIRSLE